MINPDSITHENGVPWYDTPRGFLDVVKCVLGRHKVATQAESAGRLIQRCSCGAFGPAPWVYLSRAEAKGKWKTRR